MAVKSPCIDQCGFTGKNGWCEGCGRTRKEAQDWRKCHRSTKRRLSAL
ncbi:DUF1289 domain-containing protein [Pantoea rwandensis]|nr:DUF1289 domain-containing protein [Pantoea rwandensis]